MGRYDDLYLTQEEQQQVHKRRMDYLLGDGEDIRVAHYGVTGESMIYIRDKETAQKLTEFLRSAIKGESMNIQLGEDVRKKLKWLVDNLELSEQEIIESAIEDYYQVHYGIDQEGKDNGD